MEGWIKLYRKMQDNFLWTEKRRFSKFEAFIYILFKANHKDKIVTLGFDIVKVKAGSFLTSEVKLSQEWNWDRKTVRRFLKLLEEQKMATTEHTTKYTIITVENWEVYQFKEQQIPQLEEQQENIEGTSKAHQRNSEGTSREHQEHTNKNDKNNKNNKNINIININNKARASVIDLPTNKFNTENECYFVTNEFFNTMQKLYENVDVLNELKKMKAWLLTNSTKRKTLKGMEKFINNWLSKNQNNSKKGENNGTNTKDCGSEYAEFV